MKMGQLFVNSFTLRYWSLKLSLSLHKQIKSAAFEGQDRYCIISSDWCIISSVVTVPVFRFWTQATDDKSWKNKSLDCKSVNCSVNTLMKGTLEESSMMVFCSF